MIIDCVSDLHGYFPELEGGDLLIVAGDFTASDTRREHEMFCYWLSQLNYRKKIIVAGNHDNGWLGHPEHKGPDPINPNYEWYEYLCDSGTEFEGLKIWGSPWTTTFPKMNPHCKAFTVDHESDLIPLWEKIPHDVDVLITHSPPHGIGDLVKDQPDDPGRNCGSPYLYNLLKYAIRPKLHVYGHIHEGYGQYDTFVGWDGKMVHSVNASHVNQYYHPCNKPIRIKLNDITPNRDLQK